MAKQNDIHTGNPGWRKAYLGFLNTATVLCILAGSIWHLGGWIGRGLLGVRLGGIFSGNARSEAVSSEEAETEPFREIYLDVAMGGVDIVSGNGYRISYRDYPAGKEPEWSVEDGVLTVTQRGEGSGQLSGNPFGDNRQITITVPDGASISYGMLWLSMGGLKLTDLSLGDADITASMGSVALTGCSANELNIEADMGSVTVKDSQFASGTFTADMGEIILADAEFTSASATAGMGAVKWTDVTFVSGECESNMGSVEISGSFDSLSARSSMGAIRVSCGEGARLNLTTDMGTVLVNGKNQGSEYSR